MPTSSRAATASKRRSNNNRETSPETETAAAPKRRRVSRACDQCREAREKCDGIQPLCLPCASLNRKCTWQEPKKKRGVQTGYIRTLELSLGWMFDNLPGAEESLQELLTLDGREGPSLLAGRDTVAKSRLNKRWRKSTARKEINRLLSSRGERDTRNQRSLSTTSDESDYDDEAPREQKQQYGEPRAEIQEQLLRPNRDVGSVIKLPSNAWRLLDVYFSYTHCWFPIIERPLLQKTCWKYTEEGLSLSHEQRDSSDHAELWAALALASYQEESRHPDDKPPSDCMRADDIYHIARSLIPEESGDFEIRHVNALLLLALINIGQRKLTPAWVLTGFASRLALALGLHQQSGSKGARLSTRTYSGCFILDALLSAILRRPAHIRAVDASTDPLLEEDDPDEWESWAPCSGFVIDGPPEMASRCPGRSASAFSLLYAIHHSRSEISESTDSDAAHPTEAYPDRIGRMWSSNNPQKELRTFILNGGTPPRELPSTYLLRIALLAMGRNVHTSGPLLVEVLQLVGQYVSRFGASALPPVFPAYMALISQQHDVERLSSDERDRWKEVEAVMTNVWESQSVNLTSQSSFPQSARSVHIRTASDTRPSGLVKAHNAAEQLLTPISQQFDGVEHSSTTVHSNNLLPSTSTISYSDALGRADVSSQRDLASTANAAFGSLYSPEMLLNPTIVRERPSFSGATFDYDAVLNDIAPQIGADQVQSDQFMANLGFAPGSSLADLFTQDFQGFR